MGFDPLPCRETQITELLAEVGWREEVRAFHTESASHDDREGAAIGFGDVFEERLVHGVGIDPVRIRTRGE